MQTSLCFSGFHLQRDGMFKSISCALIFVHICSTQIFSTQIFAHFFGQIFCARVQIFLQIFGAQIFCRLFLDVLVLNKIGVPESRKNALKLCRKIRGVPMALPGWVPYSSSSFLSRQQVTQSQPGPSTQGECVRVCRGIFGPKTMLAFSPGFLCQE